MGSGIAWPPGPYRPADGRARFRLTLLGWGLIVGAVLMVGAYGRDRWLPQNLADLGASAGVGRTVEGAAVESWNCGPYARDGFLERARRGIRHQCLIRVRGSVHHDYEFRTGYSGAYAPGRVAMVGGRLAVAWPAWVMAERLTDFAVPLAIGLLMFAFGLFTLRALRAARRFEGADARIADVDLLCRRMQGRGALWDLAYDFAGTRRYAKAFVTQDPVITDGVVTRGAAVIAPGGAVQLLTREAVRIMLPGETGQAIDARYHGYRGPLEPGLADLAARTPEGPERDYLTAFDRAWHDPDIAEVNRAILVRHAAALTLEPARVDALLRECRRFVVS